MDGVAPTAVDPVRPPKLVPARSAFLVNEYREGHQTYSTAFGAMDAQGNTVVTYRMENVPDAQKRGAYMRKFDAMGNPLWPETQVTVLDTPYGYNGGSVSMTADGDFLYRWHEAESMTNFGPDYVHKDYYRLYHASGQPAGDIYEITPPGLVDGLGEFPGSATPTLLENGNLFLLHGNQTGSRVTVWFQIRNPQNQPLTGWVRVDPDGPSHGASFAVDGVGRSMFVAVRGDVHRRRDLWPTLRRARPAGRAGVSGQHHHRR